MNIIIIGKRNCPHSVAAMKTARSAAQTTKIRNITSLYADTPSGQKTLRRLRRRIPMSHKTFPVIFMNSYKRGRYIFLGGNAELQIWVKYYLDKHK